ncbi:MAG: type II secretion system protein GspL [Wenzhouxiangellaceae bacterium]|nr:type II secretion system protein GspL [Wenzhouxiangellaceae bacterium]
MARESLHDIVELAVGRRLTVDARGRPRSGSPTAAPVVLVPADRVSVLRVDLPRVSARRLHEALRWAAEDAMAASAEDQHVVALERDDDERLACAVATRNDMRGWMDAVDAPPCRMVPDAVCLPWASGEVVLAFDGRQVLARFGRFGFDRLEPELLDALLPEFVEAAGPQARVVWLGDPPPGVDSAGHEVRPMAGDLLEVLAGGVEDAPVDLLQGEFAPAGADRRRRTWSLAAGLAVLLAVLVVADAWLGVAALRGHVEELDDRIEHRFAEQFPDIGTLVRPRVQAERALAALRGGQADRFVALMAGVSPLFSGAGSMQVRSVRYDGEAMLVDVAVPSTNDLDALQRQFGARGLEARIEQVTVGETGARGRLRIGESLP